MATNISVNIERIGSRTENLGTIAFDPAAVSLLPGEIITAEPEIRTHVENLRKAYLHGLATNRWAASDVVTLYLYGQDGGRHRYTYVAD